MNGTVFSIEEFSIYDGPGIRTTVFLKGCPMSCVWCHNPEGQNKNPEIIKSPNGCIECGACDRFADFSNGRKLYTNDSILHCPKKLLRVCGEDYSPEGLCTKLMKNKKILDHGGGVTFSGGEPLFQSEFLFECLDLLHGRLHTAIQTCGFCGQDVFETALEKADMFLFDLKLIDDNEHKKYTKCSNDCIKKNFSLLAKSGKNYIVRIPLIPGVTDTESNLLGIAELMKQNNTNYCELMTYNKMAGSKYKSVGREYKPPFDAQIPVQTHTELFCSMGITAKLI